MARRSAKIDDGRQQTAQVLSPVVPEKVQAVGTRREKSGLNVSARAILECAEEMGGEKFHSQEVDCRPRGGSCGITSISGRSYVGILLRICGLSTKTEQIDFSRRCQS